MSLSASSLYPRRSCSKPVRPSNTSPDATPFAKSYHSGSFTAECYRRSSQNCSQTCGDAPHQSTTCTVCVHVHTTHVTCLMHLFPVIGFLVKNRPNLFQHQVIFVRWCSHTPQKGCQCLRYCWITSACFPLKVLPSSWPRCLSTQRLSASLSAAVDFSSPNYRIIMPRIQLIQDRIRLFRHFHRQISVQEGRVSIIFMFATLRWPDCCERTDRSPSPRTHHSSVVSQYAEIAPMARGSAITL